MKEKLKSIVKVLAFLSIIVLLISVSSIAVDPTKAKGGIGKNEKVVLEIKKEEENTIDVAVLGDSEAYSAVIPYEMYMEYGFTSYIGASPAQTSYQAYEMLNTFLETQKPKVCLIEANLFFRNYSAAAAVLPKIEQTFPIFKYHNMWKGMIDSDYTYDNVASPSYKGYRYSSAVRASKNLNYMKHTDDVESISTNNLMYLGKIIDLCREEDIQIVFFRTPSTENWDFKKHNGARIYAEGNNIPFIDLNVENIKINWKYDTSDRGDHVNYKGATKVTKYIGAFLNDNYDLPDHRNEAAYAEWNEGAKLYAKQIGYNPHKAK